MAWTRRSVMPGIVMLILIPSAGPAQVEDEILRGDEPAPVAFALYAGASGTDLGGGVRAAPAVGFAVRSLAGGEHLALNVRAEYTQLRGEGNVRTGGSAPFEPGQYETAELTLHALLTNIEVEYRFVAGGVEPALFVGYSPLFVVDQSLAGRESGTRDVSWYDGMNAGIAWGLRLGRNRWFVEGLVHNGLTDATAAHLEIGAPLPDGGVLPASEHRFDLWRVAGGMTF